MAEVDVRQLRSELGFTQEQLAKVLGVSWVTVNRWENNKCSPSPLAIEKLQELATKSSKASRSKRRT